MNWRSSKFGYFGIAGSASTFNLALFILSVGNGVRSPLPSILWIDGKLDRLPYQRSLY